jgi:hypothetical protein
MQLDGVQHLVGEQAAQERERAVLVHVVDTAQRGRLAQVVHQVAQVVQQGGGDQRVVAPSASPSAAVCSACCSCVTGSPLYCSPPRLERKFDVVKAQHVNSTASIPGERVGFEVGEALDRLLHPFLIAQARVLDAAEGRELQAVAGHFAHVDGADVQLADEAVM